MRLRKWGVGAGAALALMAFAPGIFAPGIFAPMAHAANPLEMQYGLSGPRYDGVLPPCEAMLGAITAQFAEKESTFWNSALQITGYDRVHETAFRPWTSNNIPRRYCRARALLNDGKLRTVDYSIIEDGGLAGYGPGVEWCVAGLDRDWAYNPRCKAARR